MQFDQYHQLCRFTIRLLREALFLGAEHIVGAERAGKWVWRLRSGDQTVRELRTSTSVASQWQKWANGRRCSLLSEVGTERIGLRYEDEVLSCAVRDDADSAMGELFDFQSEGCTRLLGRTGFYEGHLPLVQELMHARHGMLLISSPAPDMAQELLALTEAISGATPCVVVGAPQSLLLKTAIGGYPLEALATLSLEERRRVCGVLSGVLVPRLCKRCVTTEPIPSHLFAKLPEELRSIAQTYPVSRGCAECGGRGVRGFGVLATVLDLRHETEGPFQREPEGEAAYRLAHERAVFSVADLGAMRALAGEYRLEDVVAAVPAAPLGLRALGRLGIALKPVMGTPTKLAFESSAVAPSIVLVEDDPDQREILGTLFRSHGYQVLEAEDGMSALTLLDSIRPTLVITDLMMPRLDGEGLLRHIRARPELAQLPVLVLTVLSDQERELKLLEAGANEYCLKSVQARLLLRRVAMLIEEGDTSAHQSPRAARAERSS